MYKTIKNVARKSDYKWEKYYEVLSLVNNNEILTKEDSKFPFLLAFCVRNIYNDNTTYIKSVKRLKDGRIFSIGENLTDYTGHDCGVIDKIWPSFGQMRYDIGNGGAHFDMV